MLKGQAFDKITANLLLLASMIWIVVEADTIGLLASIRFTIVLFKLMLTESVNNIEIRGETS